MSEAATNRIGTAVAEPVPAAALSAPAMSASIQVCIGVLAAELTILLLNATGRLPVVWLLALHAGVVVMLAVVLDWWERSHADSRLITIALVTVAVSGPLGALLSVLLGLYLARVKLESTLLSRWYERISGEVIEDGATLLYEQIRSGRTLNTHIDAGAHFGAIMRHGPLEEKQRVLGVIAQKYHPDFAALLALALRSPDPPVRVQAAAVAARLRGDERTRLKAVVADAAAPGLDADARLGIVERLLRVLRSGLLDEQDQAAARDIAVPFCRGAIDDGATSDPQRLLIGELLVAAGDDQEAARVLEPISAAGHSEGGQLYRQCLLRLGHHRQLTALAENSGQAA